MELVSSGIYTVSEASRLLGVSQARVKGWVMGYSGSNVGPIISGHEIEPLNGRLAITFASLMEARFVAAFVKHGLHVRTVRALAEQARELINDPHAFALYNFKTDGKSIYAQVVEETGDQSLYNLRTHNWMFHDIIVDRLHHGITFDQSGIPVEWKPEEDTNVVLNPTYSFGQPVTEATRVPTRALYDAFKVEDSFKTVAAWFDVEESEVKHAVEFELGYLQAA